MHIWQVPVREEDPLTMYRVEVKTSDIWGAGTDAEVLLNINGIRDGKVRRLSGIGGREGFQAGLGHAYFIAFFALKNKAKIRELKNRCLMRVQMRPPPPPAFPSFLLLSSLGDLT